jgi:hypothetical protein
VQSINVVLAVVVAVFVVVVGLAYLLAAADQIPVERLVDAALATTTAYYGNTAISFFFSSSLALVTTNRYRVSRVCGATTRIFVMVRSSFG